MLRIGRRCEFEQTALDSGLRAALCLLPGRGNFICDETAFRQPYSRFLFSSFKIVVSVVLWWNFLRAGLWQSSATENCKWRMAATQLFDS